MGKNGVSKDFWVGNPFMAPEVDRHELTDFGGDIWYLGITFYSLIHP